MRKVKRSERNAQVVRRHGLIPAHSELHHNQLRNPSIGYLLRVIRQTEALIAAGECHQVWGRKRLVALQKMLDAKRSAREKRRLSK
jgi:hypothetical protein